VTFQYRSSDGGDCNNKNTPGLSAPYWVKLTRSSNTFTGYYSPHGSNWTQLGSTTLTNVSTAYVGLAVTSHNNSDLCAATFDNVSAPGWPPTPLAADALAVSGSQVNLTWNALTNATSYNVKLSTTSGGPYTTIATGVTTTNYTDIEAPVSAGCYYVVSAIVAGRETPDGPQAALSFPKLTGAIIGTPGSWDNEGNTITNVFDNNLATFFDAPTANGCWVGLDFGAGVSNVITEINYCPRAGSESRMVGGIFQGASQAAFSGAVTLCTVTAQPATGVFTPATITNTAAFRYVRYLSPAGGYCNVAELQFDGYQWSIPVFPPSGLSALGVSASQINLAWNASSNATSYNVERSLTNGGPYTTVANVTTTNYADIGLIGGTAYYYVVSALNAFGESANSAQVGAWALPQPHIVNTSIAGGNVVFSGTNGWPGGTYGVLSSTNLAMPLSNWTQVGAGNFDGNGCFSVFNAINANEPQRFYLLRQP